MDLDSITDPFKNFYPEPFEDIACLINSSCKPICFGKFFPEPFLLPKGGKLSSDVASATSTLLKMYPLDNKPVKPFFVETFRKREQIAVLQRLNHILLSPHEI